MQIRPVISDEFLSSNFVDQSYTDPVLASLHAIKDLETHPHIAKQIAKIPRGVRVPFGEAWYQGKKIKRKRQIFVSKEGFEVFERVHKTSYHFSRGHYSIGEQWQPVLFCKLNTNYHLPNYLDPAYKHVKAWFDAGNHIEMALNDLLIAVAFRKPVGDPSLN